MNPSLIGAVCFAGFALTVTVIASNDAAMTATMAAPLTSRFFDIVRPFRYTDLTADQPIRSDVASAALQ
jgi:hypothetical protein